MEIETITKLLDAGYTKDEITAMQATDTPSGDNIEEAGENVAAEVEKQGNAGAENAGEVNDALKSLTETVNALTATVKAMQEKNVKGAATDSPKAGDKIKAAMDSFIESL